ncbi:MAG: heme-binding domain-containing protein [Spirochaetota bacterium]
MKKLKLILLLLVTSFFALQLVPKNSKIRNPKAVDQNLEIKVDTTIHKSLRRACYDCHSNQTNWLLYTKIFPLSLYFEHEVEEAREELNFSIWESFSLKKKSKKSFEIVESLELKEMPPENYVALHAEAKISPKELEAIKKWADDIDKEYARNQQ